MDKNKIKYYSYQLDMKVLNIFAIILFVIMLIVVYLVGYSFGDIADHDLLLLFILMFMWLMVHEVFHGIGFALFKEVNIKNIVFGMALEKGVFYCMCKQRISKKVIFTSLLFPVVIIGVITMILGVAINNSLLVYLSMFNIVGSVGDIVMSVYFCRCPNGVSYLDLDDCTGFIVLSKSDLSSICVPGIKLVNSGVYDSKNMVAKDKRRVVISKMSWVVLIIIFILILINIIGGVL